MALSKIFCNSGDFLYSPFKRILSGEYRKSETLSRGTGVFSESYLF